MKPTNEQIKEIIMFLKNKDRISMGEIADFFGSKYNFAIMIMDVLENNNIVSEFKGDAYREIVADKSIFESEFIFINIKDFV